MYTIYHQPECWPSYRVRAFIVQPGGSAPSDVLGMAVTLKLARLCIPPSADVMQPRSPGDAPEIVETWL